MDSFYSLYVRAQTVLTYICGQIYIINHCELCTQELAVFAFYERFAWLRLCFVFSCFHHSFMLFFSFSMFYFFSSLASHRFALLAVLLPFPICACVYVVLNQCMETYNIIYIVMACLLQCAPAASRFRLAGGRLRGKRSRGEGRRGRLRLRLRLGSGWYCRCSRRCCCCCWRCCCCCL